MTDFQLKLLTKLKQRHWLVATSTTKLAELLHTSNIAVHQSCRALEKKGLVLHHPPRDRWDTHKWSISVSGDSTLTQYLTQEQAI